MALALVYDPRGHTFESWSALMVEAYASQQLQTNVIEKNWQDWAVGLNAIDIFAQEAIPSPYAFFSWNDWAEAVVNVVGENTNGIY